MVNATTWRNFRDYIRGVRLNGVQVKYIGRPTKHPVFVTGTPVNGNKLFVGDLVFTERDFVNVIHLTTSFSINGVLVSQLFEE